MQYQTIVVTGFQQNCSLVWCENTKEAVIIDPGGDADLIKQAVSLQNVIIKKILITHGHIDHVGAAKSLATYYNVAMYGSQIEDAFLFEALPQQARQFGLKYCQTFLPDYWLKEGDKIQVGDFCFDVLHCPGHTPGHIAFINHPQNIGFTGDVIFNNGIGRTDFAGGNYEDLMFTIKHKLASLNDDFVFMPGHGPSSTLGIERKNNPFLK